MFAPRKSLTGQQKKCCKEQKQCKGINNDKVSNNQPLFPRSALGTMVGTLTELCCKGDKI